MLDNRIIQGLLRQRYPFLMIDRILEIENGKKVKGIKNVTINEAFFAGHFPDEPVMPGVLIIEAMAQLVGVLASSEGPSMGYLSSIYNARFSKYVVPGDQLILEAEVTQVVKNLVRVTACAFVDGNRVAKAELGFMVFKENKS